MIDKIIDLGHSTHEKKLIINEIDCSNILVILTFNPQVHLKLNK